MSTPRALLVETDVLAEYLIAPEDRVPLLRRLLECAICHTTFVQAAELLSTAREEKERAAIGRALAGVRVLGASSRYADTIGRILSSLGTPGGLRTAIVAAMARESSLPIVTSIHLDDLTRVAGIALLDARVLAQSEDAGTLEALLQRECNSGGGGT